MTVALRGFKVKVVGQANAVGPTSIDSSFFLVLEIFLLAQTFPVEIPTKNLVTKSEFIISWRTNELTEMAK